MSDDELGDRPEPTTEPPERFPGGADSVAVGTISPAGGGRYQVLVRLMDAPKQVSLGSQAMTMTPNT